MSKKSMMLKYEYFNAPNEIAKWANDGGINVFSITRVHENNYIAWYYEYDL